MHLAHRVAHHLDDLSRGGAAHDPVVDHDHALAFDEGTVDVVLELDAQVADLVARLDEGAPHVVVADDAELEGDAGLGRVADGGGHARIGDRHDHVGLSRRLARELGADALPHVVDAPPLDVAVGAREVDVLEDAEAPAHGREGLERAHAARVEHHELARLHVAHELGVDDVERAALGGEDAGAVARAAEHERAHAQRVAHPDHQVLAHADERIGALDLAQRLDDAVDQRAVRTGRDEVDDHLGVARRLEERAAALEPLAQRHRVGDVAVVPDREAALLEVGEERLHVAQDGLALGRIAHVADGDGTSPDASCQTDALLLFDLLRSFLLASLFLGSVTYCSQRSIRC